MKKKTLCLTSIATLISLASCLPINEESVEEEVYYYDMLPESRCIAYEDLFNQEEDFYMVYCFHRGCHACNSFKSYIIPYSDSHPNTPLYYADVSSLGEDIYDSNPIDEYGTESTIGLNSMEGFYLYATPSLVGLLDHKVLFNIWGTNDVQTVLDMF